MAGGPDAEALAFPQEAIDAAKVVFDVVALPAETPLIRAASAAGKTVITGAEVATIQALEQFVLYTGVRPTDEQVRAAEDSCGPSSAGPASQLPAAGGLDGFHRDGHPVLADPGEDQGGCFLVLAL